MIDCRTTKDWWQSLRERWRAWYGGLKAQWTAPWPWYQRVGAAVRYLLWWGWPFGWRRWWRGVEARVVDVWSRLIEDVLLNFVMLWLPIGVLGWVLGAWLARCLSPPLGGEGGLGGALGACLVDPPAFGDWGVGAFIAAVSLLLQYRHREWRQRAERLQARWEQKTADWLFFAREPGEKLAVLSEWLSWPRGVRRRYLLMRGDKEAAWIRLIGSLTQRFASISEGEIFLQELGLEIIWAYLASRFPSSRVWDLAVLLEQAHMDRLRLHWPMLEKVWMDIIMNLTEEKTWSRQRLVLSWLLGRMVYWNNRQKEGQPIRQRSGKHGFWDIQYIGRNHQIESGTTSITEQSSKDWLLEFRSLLDKKLLSAKRTEKGMERDTEKRKRLHGFFMFAWRDERLKREERKRSQARSELQSCYDLSQGVAHSFLFDRTWAHMHGKGERGGLHGWIWSSPDARDRDFMWRGLHAYLLREGYAMVPWRDKEGALESNDLQKSLLRSLAEAWAEWLRCKPEYFFELLPQRQMMLLNLLFAVWRTPAKVREALDDVRPRDSEWQQGLFNALLLRVASHISAENNDLTWADLEKWLHLKPPASGPLVLMVLSDQALPAEAMRPALWTWLRSIGVSFRAIVAPEHLPTPIPPEHESGVRWRALRWSAADLEEAWHRHWRACHGVPVAQELPWTAFFPSRERARLDAWTAHAAQYAQGSWSRFVEAMMRQWHIAQKDLAFDERQRRCFDAFGARLR